MDDAALGRFIRAHKVTFEIARHIEAHDGRTIPVGFDVTLHAEPAGKFDPGDPETDVLYEALAEIARRVAPPKSRLVLEPWDAAYHLRPENDWREEVQLVAELLGPGGPFEPVDDGDRRLLAAVTEGLKALGARERVWTHAAA
jgi:hypothetical protein